MSSITFMQTLRHPLRFVVLLVCATLLTACALSPQTVVVRPDIKAPSMPIGHGRSMVVNTRDLRSKTTLGTRGGLYESASLSTDSHMEQSISASAITVLQSWDFAAVPSSLGNYNMPSMEIQIIDIDYHRPETSVGGEVSVKCRVAVRVQMGSETYSGEYASRRSEQVAVMGTESGNQRMVNDTISQALNQIFLDSKLQRFLSR